MKGGIFVCVICGCLLKPVSNLSNLVIIYEFSAISVRSMYSISLLACSYIVCILEALFDVTASFHIGYKAWGWFLSIMYRGTLRVYFTSWHARSHYILKRSRPLLRLNVACFMFEAHTWYNWISVVDIVVVDYSVGGMNIKDAMFHTNIAVVVMCEAACEAVCVCVRVCM